MNIQAEPSGPVATLPVGDPRRRAMGRAAFSTLLAAAAFVVFTVPTKQLPALYDHAPWENDPYDTVYSAATFFVPLTAAFFLVQVSLCLKRDPLPVSRVRSILRACRLALVMMAATLLSCWLSVAVGANKAQWTRSATVVLVAGLVVVTGLMINAGVRLFQVPRFGAGQRRGRPSGMDWLGDAVAVAYRESRWFGPLRPGVVEAVAWLDRTLMSGLRRHPVAGAAVSSLIFGLAAGINQGIGEGYFLVPALLTVGLLTCGMFAFLMLAGSYLGIVRSDAPAYGLQRRLVDASVIGCVGAIVALAFRNSLWWIVGTNASAAGNGRFASLLGLAMLVAFTGALGVESILHTHSRPQGA
jgi:hypothetical protein